MVWKDELLSHISYDVVVYISELIYLSMINVEIEVLTGILSLSVECYTLLQHGMNVSNILNVELTSWNTCLQLILEINCDEKGEYPLYYNYILQLEAVMIVSV